MSNLQHEERCVSGRWAPLALGGLPRRRHAAEARRGGRQAGADVTAGNDDAGTGQGSFSASQHAAAVLDAADTDRSGDISAREMRHMLRTHRDTAWAREPPPTDEPHHGRSVTSAEAGAMAAERTEAIANDIWSFQDVDRDGVLTRAELEASAERWYRSLRRSADAQRTRRRMQPRAAT